MPNKNSQAGTINDSDSSVKNSGGGFAKKLSRAFVQYKLPILSGVFIGTSYIPFPPWAIFFCLVPLILFWRKPETTLKQALFGGWLTQFILNLIGFYWIAYTAVEFGHFPWWAGVLVLLGFAATAHLYYPLGGFLGMWATRKFGLKTGASFFVIAFAFALCDLYVPKIFPWHFGYPWMWAKFPGAQFGDVIGFEGLNVLTIFVNTLLAWSISVAGGLKKIRLSPLATKLAAAAVVLALLPNILGFGRAAPWARTDAELSFLGVQANIGNFEKLQAERGGSFGVPVVEKFTNLTRKALEANPTAQIVVWPETAMPTYLDNEAAMTMLGRRIFDFAREIKLPLITGAYSVDAGTPRAYNAFFVVDENGRVPVSPYRKSILLAFGETFPFSEYIPYMEKLFPNQGSYTRGPGPTVKSVAVAGRQVQIGPQICYEGLYPWFTAALAEQGAQVILNVTNDSWYGKSFERYQHLYMTLARAIEFRRPLVRITNTGISTAVLATGEVLEHSPMEVEWTGLFRIPYITDAPHTPYEKYGWLWPWALALGLVLLLGFGREKDTREPPRP